MRPKNLILPILLVMLSFFLITKPAVAFWPFNNSNSNSTFPPLIQKIIDKFKLNKDEVKKVIEEQRNDRQKQMQAKYEEWLNILVKAGKINEIQKQALLKKHAELQVERQNQWQARQQKRTELENWAKENNIDTDLLFGFGGFGMRRGRHGPFFK